MLEESSLTSSFLKFSVSSVSAPAFNGGGTPKAGGEGGGEGKEAVILSETKNPGFFGLQERSYCVCRSARPERGL